MGYDRDDILEQIEKNIPTKCERCGARLYFKGSGRYVCPRCHVDYYDDFGVIKKYIDENGPAPAVEISVETGVKLEVIGMLLEKGRLEMPGELKEAERCERCGALFPIGRYCKECIEDTSKGIMNIFKNEEAQRRKFAISKQARDKETKDRYEKDRMHYLNHIKDKW